MQETACNNNIQCNHCTERWAILKPPFDKYRVSTKGRMTHVNRYKVINNITSRMQKTKYGQIRIVALHYYDEKGNIHETKRSLPLIIAETFIPNPCNYKTVRLKDGNLDNMNVENIEWTKEKGYRYKSKQSRQ